MTKQFSAVLCASVFRFVVHKLKLLATWCVVKTKPGQKWWEILNNQWTCFSLFLLIFDFFSFLFFWLWLKKKKKKKRKKRRKNKKKRKCVCVCVLKEASEHSLSTQNLIESINWVDGVMRAAGRRWKPLKRQSHFIAFHPGSIRIPSGSHPGPIRRSRLARGTGN